MFELTLAVICLAIAVRALRQVREDPRFIRSVILRQVMAIALYLLFMAISGFLLLRSGPWPWLNAMPPEVQSLLRVFAFLVIMVAGMVLLVRFLNRMLKDARH